MIEQYACMFKIIFIYFVRKIKLCILIKLYLLNLQLKTCTDMKKLKSNNHFVELFYRVDQ